MGGADVPEGEILFWVPQWWIAGSLIVLMVVVVEIGMRLGTRARLRGDEKELSTTVPSAVLGLLALLLAFTYSLSTSHYDERKKLVLEEANAIGTAWLRADVAPSPQREELRALLEEYADLRVGFSQSGVDRATLTRALAETDRLHARIWATAVRSSQGRSPHPLDSLILQSLNDVIDVHAARLRAMRDHVPEVVIYLLVFVAAVAVGTVGYGAGHHGERNRPLHWLLPLLVVAVITVTIDLDRPRRGFITTSQQPLIDLAATMKAAAAAPR